MTAQPTRDQLRALADAATEGPWHPHARYVWTSELGGIIQNWSDDANAAADMEFIAAARQAVPALLEALDQAEAQRDQYARYIGVLGEQVAQADRAEARIKAVRDVLDQAESTINHHPAYRWSGQRMDPIINGASIRRALEG